MIFAILYSLHAWAALPSDFLQDLEQFKSKSTLLRSEVQRLDAASSALTAKYMSLTPAVNLAAGKSRTSLNGQHGTSDYWRATADWNLFRGGSDFFAWRAAKENTLAQKLQTRSQELKVELQAAKLIFRRLYLLDVQKAQIELFNLKEETLRIGRNRYAQGKIPQQDVSKMEVDLSQQKNSLRKAQIDVAENEAAYRVLFVNNLKTQDWPFTENRALKLEGTEGSLETQKLVHLSLAQEAHWKSLLTRHSPSLDLNLSWKQYPFHTRANHEWSGVLELSFPLWSRWETVAASAQGYAQFVQARGEAETGEREEELQKDFLRKKILVSQENLIESKKNLDRSDRLYQDMLRSFQLGRLSTNDLFQEQNRKIQSVLFYAENRLSFHEAVMEACTLWGLNAQACL